MLATLKRRARENMRGRPGHRFQDRYAQSKKEKQSGASGRRIVNLVLGVGALAVGVLLVIFPGPAIPFLFIGGLLLAAESLVVARAMDWLELKVRAAWNWSRKRWDRLPKPARIALKVLAPCASITSAYLSWRLWHS